MVFGLFVDVILIAVLVVNVIIGYRKGLSAVIFGFLCTFVATIIALIFFRPIGNLVINKSQADEFLSDGIYRMFETQGVKDGQLMNEEDTKMSNQIVQLINNFISEALEKTADSALTYTSMKLSHLIIYVATFIIIIIVLRLLFGLLEDLVDILVRLPILKQINNSGGLIVGAIKGFLLIYVVFAVFAAFSPMIADLGILRMIQASKIGSVLYNDNLLLKILSNFI
ncbi:MAG: CvpA family protein [Clostridia bacterium]|nr:CvpA family protein [Clostridia bacterium]